MLAELRVVVAEAAPDSAVELVLARPPLACDPGSRLARSVREAATRVLGRPPREIGAGF